MSTTGRLHRLQGIKLAMVKFTGSKDSCYLYRSNPENLENFFAAFH